MIFKGDDLGFIAPLELVEGRRYVEPVENGEIENLYNLTSQMEYYFNPTMDGMLYWCNINPCASDYNEYLEDW